MNFRVSEKNFRGSLEPPLPQRDLSLTEAELQRPATGDWFLIIACGTALWLVNAVWLKLDTRPPVWDMALHQMLALNYVEYFAGLPGPALRVGARPTLEGGEKVWE